LKIMHLSTRLILGGSQENTLLSCMGQADDGHEVVLAFGPIYGPEGSLLDRARSHGGIRTVEVPDLVRHIAPVRDVRCRSRLRRLIREHRPDVVHTHSSKAGILGRLAARVEGVPAIVHTIHGLPFHPYQSRIRNGLYIALERMAAGRCDAIVCVADAMRDQALAAGVGRPGLYSTIYSGMETESFMNPACDPVAWRARHGLGSDDFVVGTVARLAELKGHDDLLKAMQGTLLAERSIKLLWVGDGYLGAKLRRQVEKLGLADRVVFTGALPPDQMPAVMHSIDLLVHPSLREGLPRTVPQALLSGTPVVAYDVDGTREAVIDGETGRLVTPGDVDGLARSIMQARADPQMEGRLAQRGRERCSRMFPARRMVDELEGLYRSILERKARGGQPG